MKTKSIDAWMSFLTVAAIVVIVAVTMLLFTGNLFAVDHKNQKACLNKPGDDQTFATAFIGALTAKKVPIITLANCEGAGTDFWRVDLSSTVQKSQLG